MDVLIAIGTLSLIITWLARRGALQTDPRSRFAGSTDIIDRDAERVADELQARHAG